MAKNVDDGFQVLIGWLTPTGTENSAAASHRASIEARLKSDFAITSFFQSGSFGHHTSVSAYSDVDYFAVIPLSNLKQNSASTLQAVRNSLAARFPQTGVTVRSPAVVVPFGTTPAERHEITPAEFLFRSAGGHNVYDIPDRYTGWMRSSPSAHNAWVNGAHAKLANRVKPLIRLVKAWNYYRGVGIRSFYLELRTTEFAKTQSTIMYKFDFLSVLRQLRAKSLAAMQDPMGISGLVYPCSDAVKAGALSKIDTAIIRAEKAREAESKGDLAAAFQWWDLVFDGRFPAHY